MHVSFNWNRSMPNAYLWRKTLWSGRCSTPRTNCGWSRNYKPIRQHVRSASTSLSPYLLGRQWPEGSSYMAVRVQMWTTFNEGTELVLDDVVRTSTAFGRACSSGTTQLQSFCSPNLKYIAWRNGGWRCRWLFLYCKSRSAAWLSTCPTWISFDPVSSIAFYLAGDPSMGHWSSV